MTKTIEGQNYVRVSEQTLYLIDTIISCGSLMDRLITASEQYMPFAQRNQRQLIEQEESDFASNLDPIRHKVAAWAGESISLNLSQSCNEQI